MSKRKKCYICLRIPESRIFRIGHKLLDKQYKEDKIKAHKLVLLVCETFEELYHLKPTVFCSKRSDVILSVLFYRVVNQNKIELRRKDIRKVLSYCQPSFLKLYRELFDEVPLTVRYTKFKRSRRNKNQGEGKLKRGRPKEHKEITVSQFEDNAKYHREYYHRILKKGKVKTRQTKSDNI